MLLDWPILDVCICLREEHCLYLCFFSGYKNSLDHQQRCRFLHTGHARLVKGFTPSELELPVNSCTGQRLWIP